MTTAVSWSVRVVVEGRPAPKGSRIAARTKDGKPYTYPASKYEAPWVAAVAEATRQVMRREDTIEPPYAVELEFLIGMPRPDNWRKAGSPSYPAKTGGDLDKLARAVIDGLVKGGAMTDDRHVVELHASKRWAAEDEAAGVRCLVRAKAHDLQAVA